MTFIPYFSQIVMLIGLIIWLATDRPKVSEVGRIMFAMGLLVTCLNGVK